MRGPIIPVGSETFIAENQHIAVAQRVRMARETDPGAVFERRAQRIQRWVAQVELLAFGVHCAGAGLATLNTAMSGVKRGDRVLKFARVDFSDRPVTFHAARV